MTPLRKHRRNVKFQDCTDDQRRATSLWSSIVLPVRACHESHEQPTVAAAAPLSWLLLPSLYEVPATRRKPSHNESLSASALARPARYGHEMPPPALQEKHPPSTYQSHTRRWPTRPSVRRLHTQGQTPLASHPRRAKDADLPTVPPALDKRAEGWKRRH